MVTLLAIDRPSMEKRTQNARRGGDVYKNSQRKKGGTNYNKEIGWYRTLFHTREQLPSGSYFAAVVNRPTAAVHFSGLITVSL